MNFSTSDMVIVMSSMAILLIVLMMGLIYGYFLKKKTELLISRKNQRVQFEKEIAITSKEMQEHTLTHVGRELHDDLGQKLSVARMLNSQLLNNLKLAENRENLIHINDLIGECIQDIRNLSKTFISEQVEHFGLISSLQLEVLRINKINQAKLIFQHNTEDVAINPEHALIIFRVIQELLNNSLKHSKAREIILKVEESKDKILISLVDNGIGYDKSKVGEGSGIINIINRIKLIEAEIFINSKKGIGTENLVIYHKNKS